MHPIFLKAVFKDRQFIFFVLIVMLLIIRPGFSFGQQEGVIPGMDPAAPTVVVAPSPIAASLFKDVSSSVGYYTGTVHVSVPIWTVILGNLSVPISLNYSSNGIKVEEEAGLVGLGWNLNAGGAISRSVVGVPDESHTIQMEGYQSSAGLLQMPPPNSDPTVFEQWLENISTCNLNKLSKGQMELTPDLYFMNFNGHSAKLFYDQNSTPYISPNKAWKITNDNNGYRVVVEDGTIYEFNAIEYMSNENQSSLSDITINFKSSWFLTRIISPDMVDTIMFNYKPVSYGTNTIIKDESKSILNQLSTTTLCAGTGASPGLDNIITSTQSIGGIILSSINTCNQRVVFVTGNNRIDLPDDGGGLKMELDSIKIYVLHNISDSSLIKQFALSYDYSNGITVANETRLTLTSVKELDVNSSVGAKYSFLYNSGLPSKASKAQDGWGFYNGASSNTSLIPTFVNYLGTVFPGADRSVNANYSGIGMLNQVTYPTGGHIRYEYEQNDYKALSSSIVNNTIDAHTHGIANSPTFKKITFHITFEQSVIIQYYLQQNRQNDGGAEIDLVDSATNNNIFASAQSTSAFQTVTKGLIPGTYYITASTSFAGETAVINLQYKSTVYVYNLPAPGSRVKRISYYSDATSVKPTKITHFIYKYDNTFSSGQTLNAPVYSATEYAPQYCTGGSGEAAVTGKVGDWIYYTQHATSLNTLGRTQGNNIGYSKVTVLHGDNGEDGSEVFYYLFNNDLGGRGYPYAPSTSLDDLRGILLQKQIYDAAGNLIENVTNNYTGIDNPGRSSILYKYVFGAKVGTLKTANSADANGCPSPINGANGWEFQYESYNMYQFLPQLISSVDAKFDINGHALSTITNYTYDPLTFMVTNQSSFSSKGDSISLTNKYPKDFAGTLAYDSMMARHIISPIIETDQYKNTSLISKSINEYELWSNNKNMIVPKDKQIQKGNNPIETRLQFYNYNNTGNILEQSKTSDVHEVYLWGYNHEYPVAKIVGSDYNTVNSIIQQSVLDNPSDDQSLRNELNKLRNSAALKNALVTTYTYNLLIGISSETDPSGRTTFYQYDSFGRLRSLKDQDGNIVKQFDYKYAGQ